MLIVSEEVEGVNYIDIVLMPEEINSLEDGKIINGHFLHKRRQCYVGIYVEGKPRLSYPEGEDE